MDNTFMRVEKKYLLTKEQYTAFMEKAAPYMRPDEYGLHTICNIYYDTEHFDLVRRSIEKPVYKEKLRVRSYGIPTESDEVFLELKKKYNGVVYKRRVKMPIADCNAFLETAQIPARFDNQIMRELAYFIRFYKPQPAMYIAYDRQAYVGTEDERLRFTFDTGIRSRSDCLDLTAGDRGELLLSKDQYLLEVKIPDAMPLWLVKLLTELSVYPVSFSKYGSIYAKSETTDKGETSYVS